MEDTDILLINSPSMWPRLAHLGIASISAYLKSRNINAKVIDLNRFFFSKMPHEIKKIWEIPVFPSFSDSVWDFLKYNYPELLNETIEYIIDLNPRFYGFSIWHSNKVFSNNIVHEIKKRNPSRKVIYGGPEITLSANSDLEFYRTNHLPADYYVAGEGEKAVETIIKGYNSGNLIYFDEIDNLDEIPSPDFKTESGYPRDNAYPVWMNRGCIRKCRFCVEHTLHKKFRAKSPAIIVNELEYYSKIDGIQSFVFYDSLINGDLTLFDEFLTLMSRMNLKWESQILIRDDMPDQIFRKIKDSGCYNLFIGFESGCDRILNLMRKGFDTKTASVFFRNLTRHNIHFEISLIIGFPGETDSDFAQTLDFLAENASYIPKIAQVNPFIHLAGAPINEIQGDISLETIPLQIIEKRIEKLLDLCAKHNIRYTKSYINNLIGYYDNFDFEKGRII